MIIRGGSRRPRTPIVALTADVMSRHLEDYRLAGADAVVAKPIQFVALAQAISSVLDPAIDTEAPALMRPDRLSSRAA